MLVITTSWNILFCVPQNFLFLVYLCLKFKLILYGRWDIDDNALCQPKRSLFCPLTARLTTVGESSKSILARRVWESSICKNQTHENYSKDNNKNSAADPPKIFKRKSDLDCFTVCCRSTVDMPSQ